MRVIPEIKWGNIHTQKYNPRLQSVQYNLLNLVEKKVGREKTPKPQETNRESMGKTFPIVGKFYPRKLIGYGHIWAGDYSPF